MSEAIAKAAKSAKRAQDKLLKQMLEVTPPPVPTGNGADLAWVVRPTINTTTGQVGIQVARNEFGHDEALILRDHLNQMFPPEREQSSFGQRCKKFCEDNPEHEKAAELAKYSPTPIRKKRAKKAAKKTRKKQAQPAKK